MSALMIFTALCACIFLVSWTGHACRGPCAAFPSHAPKPLPISAKLAVAVCMAAPLAGFALYLREGRPDLVAAPAPESIIPSDANAVLAKLRAETSAYPPNSLERARGLALLGQVEERIGFTAQAAQDWQDALDNRFNPDLAYALSVLRANMRGYTNPKDRRLLERALNAASSNAAWRLDAESRIAQAEHEEKRLAEEGFADFDVQEDEGATGS